MPSLREFGLPSRGYEFARNHEVEAEHSITRRPLKQAARVTAAPIWSSLREFQAVLRSRAYSLPNLQLRRSYFPGYGSRPPCGDAISAALLYF